MDKNIGFIGLGNVGSKLANNLLKGKFNLFINDLNKNKANDLIQKGAIWCSTLEEVAINSTVVITCLPSPKHVSKVIEGVSGLLNFFNKKHLWIEMSTTDENEMIRLSNLLKNNNGTEVLESPITGGQHRADSGNISILTSGLRYNFDRALPLLKELGHEILYCGKIGNASTLKVITNFLASVNLVSLGEALMVAKKYGLDLETAYHGIRISSGNSFVHETESQVILNGSYDVGFTMDLVCKDVGLFDKLTKKFDIPADLSKLILKIFNKGKKDFGKRAFSTSIVKRLENYCGENLRHKNFPSILVDNCSKKKGFEVKF